MKFLIFLLIFLLLTSLAPASDFLFYKELNLIGGYSRKDHWVGKSDTLSNSVGFEHYGKFSSQYGDYLTTDLQVRFAYDSTEGLADAWGFEFHNAWAEYRANGEFKIKAGHFDPPFGLEPVVDTHGTILQTLAERDIGFKKDWGVSLRGSFAQFDYEVAYSLGSGMSFWHRDDSFLVAGRLGSVPVNNFQYGISGLIGNVLKTKGMSTLPRNGLLSNKSVFKERVGFDCQYTCSSFLLKGETAYGVNDGKNVMGYMVEADFTAPKSPNWGVETQFQSWVSNIAKSRTDDTTFSICLSYKPTSKVTVRSAFIQDLHMYSDKRDTRFLVQLYYYGE